MHNAYVICEYSVMYSLLQWYVIRFKRYKHGNMWYIMRLERLKLELEVKPTLANSKLILEPFSWLVPVQFHKWWYRLFLNITRTTHCFIWFHDHDNLSTELNLALAWWILYYAYFHDVYKMLYGYFILSI